MPEQLGIAMVGARDSVMGFRALGLDVFPVATPAQAAQAFDDCVQRGYAAIFVTEGFAAELAPRMRALSARPLPATIVIPEGQESSGLGLAKLRAIVEKAIGADILFRGEDTK
jgi:V/A-type H+/Na+-transporting ATPase subunit F